ncbi:hypothetical protein [Desertivirga xinjiangensis]|uniref:hypothetical protein n=1 Tax=Desertivirga xinjiangensis TaxID=539206 RepID=UPI00210F0248|nr:hypothetical protein [Pedobacter xinjiangensis]
MDNLRIFDNPQRLSLPGFQKQETYVDKMYVYPPGNLTVDEWYVDFRTRFFDALENGKKFPVFRSSHGEFLFVLGKMEAPQGFKRKCRFFLSRVYRTLMFQSVFYSSGVPGHGYETYKQWRLPALRKNFAKYLKWIGDNGILCMYFSDRDAYPISYQKSYLAWLNKNGIYLTQENYGHIYFIYALLNGPDRKKIFSNRKLLVISSDQPARTKSLIDNLSKLNTKTVDFISISPGKSMEDKITLNRTDYDLCIIGGGVGAANIINQLQVLNCPVLDAGFIIDFLAYPDKVSPRIYSVNDDYWEKVYPDNDPEWGIQFKDK